jgi:dihydrofolate synthase/folylpolyglutamate synthase
MTYEEAIGYWYGLVDYEKSTPKAADLNLDRMRALLAQLGNPQERLRIIHIAGSKGKGSTAAMFASIAQAAGLRAGLFTSPHLVRVEERVSINGQPIDARRLAASMKAMKDAAEQANVRPSFFEVATALAFHHFASEKVDLAVMEVGLGGRFDSTNVCNPLLSVITSISFDHMDQLGNRLAQITREKAGIIKPGRPIVSGATPDEARAVVESVSQAQGAPLSQLGIDFHEVDVAGHVEPHSAGKDEIIPGQVRVRTQERTWPAMTVGLLGHHQAANAAVVVAGIEQLRRQGLVLSDEAVRHGLANVRWPARMEVLGWRPLVVLDCAHNVASAQAVIDTLRASFPAGPRTLLFAASRDKDLEGILETLLPHFQQVIFTRFTNNPRAAEPGHLADLARKLDRKPVIVESNPETAWPQARAVASQEGLICVTGSVFLAGQLRPIILAQVAGS